METSNQGAYLSCWIFWRERPEDLEAAMIEATQVMRVRQRAPVDFGSGLLILPLAAQKASDALEER
jgi:hypothetical protein